MFEKQEEIQNRLDLFCKNNNVDNKIFEVSTISSATGGKAKELQNNTKVKNENCTYVIKYYKTLDLFLVWNYRANKCMNCSLKTVENKLNKGIMCSDKGKNNHSTNQSLIYFSCGKDFEKVLYLVTNNIC